MTLGYPSRSNIIIRILRKKNRATGETDVREREEEDTAGCEDGKRAQGPSNAAASRSWKRPGNGFWSLQEPGPLPPGF